MRPSICAAYLEFFIGRAALLILALLRVGIPAIVSPRSCWSVTPTFHPYRMFTAVCFLLHCPTGHPDWPLASTLLYAAPTLPLYDQCRTAVARLSCVLQVGVEPTTVALRERYSGQTELLEHMFRLDPLPNPNRGALRTFGPAFSLRLTELEKPYAWTNRESNPLYRFTACYPLPASPLSTLSLGIGRYSRSAFTLISP